MHPCVIRCCLLAKQEEDECGPAFDQPQLSKPPEDPEIEELLFFFFFFLRVWVPLVVTSGRTEFRLKTFPGPLPGKSSPAHLQVTRLRGDVSPTA